MTDESDDTDLQNVIPQRLALYRLHRDPFLLIIAWSVVFALAAICLFFFFDHQIRDHSSLIRTNMLGSRFDEIIQKVELPTMVVFWHQVIFIGFLSGFIALWYVYFKSKLQDKEKTPNADNGHAIKPNLDYPYAIQSLRRYLSITAVNWQRGRGMNGKWDTEYDHGDDPVDALRRKASASMEVAAILIVTDLLLIEQVGQTLSVIYQQPMLNLWDISILLFILLSSAISLVCYVISIDSLDSMFNKYTTLPSRRVSVHYFYQRTVNHRYIAMLAMIYAVLLYISYINIYIGTTMIIITVSMGYCLWFPDISKKSIEFGAESIASHAYELLDDKFHKNKFPRRIEIEYRHMFAMIAFQYTLYIFIEICLA